MSGRNIVVIFDGTGPVDDSKYNELFKGSFCRQIYERVKGSDYSRGVPGEESRKLRTIWTMLDDSVPDKVSHGSSVIADSLARRESGAKIFLIGHSRGGLCCVLLAQKLAEMKIPVEAMFLFDAVNMTFKSNCDVPGKNTILLPPIVQLEISKYLICRAVEGFGDGYGGVIPGNVRHVYHAMRDYAFANQFHAEVARKRKALLRQQILSGGIVTSPGMIKLHADLQVSVDRLNRTRSNAKDPLYDWGNCATKAASPKTSFTTEKFMGSHGAIGGCPWPKDVFETDEACTSQVKKWMWPFIETHRLFDPGVALLIKGRPRLGLQHYPTARG